MSHMDLKIIRRLKLQIKLKKALKNSEGRIETISDKVKVK